MTRALRHLHSCAMAEPTAPLAPMMKTLFPSATSAARTADIAVM